MLCSPSRSAVSARSLSLLHIAPRPLCLYYKCELVVGKLPPTDHWQNLSSASLSLAARHKLLDFAMWTRSCNFYRTTAYMLSALYAIACPSVHPSVRRVDHRKTVEVRIMKFSPYGSPIPLVFAG